jgi:hypothetical protein
MWLAELEMGWSLRCIWLAELKTGWNYAARSSLPSTNPQEGNCRKMNKRTRNA